MDILIVDDHEENIYFLSLLLKGHGHTVHPAVNGVEALEILNRQQVALVISDILMPVMDGFQLCRAIKADAKFADVPVIFYTATYTGPQDEELSMKVGASRFVVKPSEPDELMRVVNEVLAESRTKARPTAPVAVNDEEVLKLYSERLVRKLEQKMLELEAEVVARKEAEKVLIASERRYRSLYDSIRDALVVASSDRIILACNPAFETLFGFAPDEVVGRSISLIYEHEKDFAEVSEIMNALNETNNSIRIISFLRRDGTVFTGETNLFCLYDDADQFTGYVCMIRDITERINAEKARKNLELQLQQAQKMESLGLLAGGVAHDFNNLLSVILGYSEIMQSHFTESDKNYEYAHEIHQAGLRARGLTTQLLAFSRKQRLEKSSVDACSVVSGFQKLLARMIGEEVKLQVCLPDLQLPVVADVGQLEQVLMNLAINARDAMPGGGTLTIEVARAEFDVLSSFQISELPPGAYAMIAVSDTGCGISSENVSRIFEPFFTTKDKGGTGLGLAVSYGIIKQHGGSIWVYTEAGRGTTFKIYLPLNKEADSVVEADTGFYEKCDATILVIEDDKTVLNMINEILTRAGYRVISSSDPVDALILAKGFAENIHLIISDLKMPRMRGPQVCEQICQLHPEAKVVFMSGYPTTALTEGSDNVKKAVFLRKPIMVNSLLSKCRQILSQSKTP
ncbi:MAG TPA: response regulator [Candidatus Rifleibacterium sp.]|nr:response regulator [Candidatus Rifleibacterium sp.]